MQFVNAQDAVSAMSALDGSIFQGRLLHILPARKAPAPAEATEKVTPTHEQFTLTRTNVTCTLLRHQQGEQQGAGSSHLPIGTASQLSTA